MTTKTIVAMQTSDPEELGTRVTDGWRALVRGAAAEIRPLHSEVCVVGDDGARPAYQCILLAHFADDATASRWREDLARSAPDPWGTMGIQPLLEAEPTVLWVDVRDGRGRDWLDARCVPRARPFFTTFEFLRRRGDIDRGEFARLWWEHKGVADRVLAGRERAPAYVQNLIDDLVGPEVWDGVAEVSRDDAPWGRPSEWFDQGPGAEIAAHEALFLERSASRFVRTERRRVDDA